MSPLVRIWAVAAALALPLPLAHAATLSGLWLTPAGKIEIKESPEGLVGTLVEPVAGCEALTKGAPVLRGTLLDDTFSGELRVCLEGPQCTAKESWLSALLLSDAKGQQLSGAMERGGDACHAKLPGKGGVTLRRALAAGSRKADVRTRLDPKRVKSAQKLIAEGMDLLGNGQAEAAQKRFKAALEIAPLPEAHNGIGVTHYFRHEYEDALAEYRQAIEVDPDFGDAYYNMACVYALTERRDQAFKFLGLALKNRYHDLSTLDDDQDLRSLRGDPRYAALKQAAERR